MSNVQTRAQARRNTLLAQGAALALAAVAVGAVLIGVPGVSAPHADIKTVDDVLADHQAEQARLAQAKVVKNDAAARAIDLDAIAQRLSVVHEVPKQTVEVATEDAGETAPTEPVAQSAQIKYLGLIEEPNRQLAVLSVEGQQRIVPIGKTATFTPEGSASISIKLVSVSGGVVEIERDGKRERLAKAERTGGTVTRVAGSEAAGVPSAGNPAVQVAPQSPDQAEIERRRREANDRRRQIMERRNEWRNQQGDQEN